MLSHAEPCVRFYYSLSFNSKVTSVKALSDPHPAELLAVPSALALNLGSVFLTMTGALHRSGGGGGRGRRPSSHWTWGSFKKECFNFCLDSHTHSAYTPQHVFVIIFI